MQPDRVARDDGVEKTRLPLESADVRRSRAAVHVSGLLPRAADEDCSVDNEWRRRLCNVTTWIAALNMQALVVRNAAGSIACAWIANALYTLGNIFSGKWYLEQSRNELLVANSAYASITFCAVVFLAFMPLMLSLRYSDRPEWRPTVGFSFKKLTRATSVYFIATFGIMFATSSLVAFISSAEPEVFKYKIDCYVDSLALPFYFTGISRAVKQIYYKETRQGQNRLNQEEHKHKPNRSQIRTTAVVPVQPLSSEASSSSHNPKFLRAYIKALLGATPPILGNLFVHILSRQRIVDRGNAVIYCFVVAGIVFKLAIQELAKHYIFKKRVRSARAMCVLVGIPTVLIDTQARIVLLGTNSTQTGVMGALGMAFVEIILRAGKAVLVMREIHHRERVSKRRAVSTLQRPRILNMFTSHSRAEVVPQAPNAPRPSLITGLSEFELWRNQVQAFHTAELNADMYAEYISIGCSASILFFYGKHPHYSLLRQSVDAETVDVATWRLSQLSLLGLQIGLEIGVDYVSIVLEMVVGIEFDHVKNLGSFLAVLFMVAAVMNIMLSMCLYLN